MSRHMTGYPACSLWGSSSGRRKSWERSKLTKVTGYYSIFPPFPSLSDYLARQSQGVDSRK